MILRKKHLGIAEAWFCRSFVDYPVPPILLIAHHFLQNNHQDLRGSEMKTIGNRQSLPFSGRTTTRTSEDHRGRKNHRLPAERPRFLRHNKDGWLSFPKPTCFLHNQEIWPFPPQQPRGSHLAGLPRHKRLSSGRMFPVRVPNQPLRSALDDYPNYSKRQFWGN